MKHDWKKQEKQYYQPQAIPGLVIIPAFKFFTISGQGNPNDDFFGDYIAALYAVSYGVKMSPKAGISPKEYREYTIYPLEGVWDLTDKAKLAPSPVLDKNELVFTLMIRQPDFVTEEFANDILEQTRKKKPQPLLKEVKFEVLEEGPCIQMLHTGSYDNEPASFRQMEAFAQSNHLNRKFKTHREVYLSDSRKTPPEKLKTILRFQIV